MYFLTRTFIALGLTALVNNYAFANDARAIALGGVALSNGQGVHGVFANPATLQHLKRRGQGFHLRLGAAGDFRDPGKFLETALDNTDLANQITNNINTLANSQLECNDLAANTVCLSNTQALGADFSRVLDIVNTISQKPIEILADAQAGFGYTKSAIPFAIHFGYTVSVAGEVGVSENDIAYLTVLENALIDGQLTVGDFSNSVVAGVQILSFNPNLQGPIEVVRPQDVLTSQFGGVRLDRRQFGISFGHTFQVANRSLDVGVTPKVSSITTYRASGSVASEFDATTPGITDQFLAAETNSTTFTMDIGGTYSLSDTVAMSAVLRNAIPETANSSFDSFTVKTTPQLLVGGAMQFNRFILHADAALNNAKRDGVSTQPISLGAEFGQGNYSLRSGISIDNGRSSDKAALTLGFGLGPLQVGARVSSLNAIQAGAQLSYSFR